MNSREVYNKFKAEILERRKAHDPIAKAMQLVKTEADKVQYSNNARTPVDADLFKVLKTTIAGLKEILRHSSSDMFFQRDQIMLFNSYLPRMLTKKDLVVAISGIMAENGVICSPEGMRSMGIVMKTLKEKFPGRYDGKAASDIFKDIIS